MGSSKMAINSLLQDSPASARVPAQPQPQPTQNHISQPTAAQPRNFAPVPVTAPGSPSAPPKKPARSRRKDAPLLVQRAVTTPQQSTFNRTSTPSLPTNAVSQAQRTQPSPPLSSGSTLGSTKTISSALSTPSGDYRPALPGRMMTTPPMPQHRNPTEKMDFLADLAAMQHPQQGQTPRNLRTSIDLPRSPSISNVSRRGSAMPANDHPMSDAPTATLQPRTFTATSLSKSELQTVADLTKQLSENTFHYDSHAQLIKILHKGLISHISPPTNPDAFNNPHEYTLLSDLRQAREAMDSRFPVGEDLWLDWIQDECMLAETIDDRIAVMDLCAKAVRDEAGSTKIWRLYGDWMWHLYCSVNDVSSTYESSLSDQESVVGRVLANHYWTEDEKVVGREVFNWTPMIGVWEEGVKATEWHIHASHAVWNPYLELLLYDLAVNASSEKVQTVGALFSGRLRQPHATWDETFSKFSQFVSKYDNANYENIMVSTNEDASEAKHQYGLRQESEMRLQRAAESGDRDTEWTVMTEYLEWEAVQAKKPKKFQFGLDLFVGLSQRSNLRFPTDASLWEDHVDFLAEHTIPQYSLLQVVRNATRHCPWSGNLWSKRLIALEAAGHTFAEIEDVKHHATSTGLLEEVGGMDEVIKVCTSWCGYLRRRAFAEDAAEEDIDVAEVGLKSELENVTSLGSKKFGKDFKGDSQFRVERIWIKFLSQAGRYDESRSYWLSLSTTHGERWEFWERFYLWEMTVWAKYSTTAGKTSSPDNATAALQRAIRQPNLDWPERMIESYLHHCAQHESVQKIQEAQVEATRATKSTVKRRAREAAEAAEAAAAQQELSQSVDATEESSVTGKRKREEDAVMQDEVPAKRNRSDVDINAPSTIEDVSMTASSEVKRDRENTTIIVKKLPNDTTETRIRQFFRDCGTILSLQLIPDEDVSTATATIEFESKEDVLTAQTKSMKTFHGSRIEIQVGTGTTLFVTNYPAEADEEYIRDLFKTYGEIVEVRFPSLKFDTHRRFCYVQFLSSRDAQTASTELDGKALAGGLKLQAKLSDPNAKKARTGAMEEGREIYVGNVSWDATEKDLKALFDSYGTVQHARIPRNLQGRSKGTAFVVFATKEEAIAALEMNLKEFKERVLKVTISKSNANGPKRVATTIINSASPDPESTSHNSPAPDAASRSSTAESPLANPTMTSDGGGAKDHRSRTLILRNIPDTVNDARIRALAEPYGSLIKCSLIPGKGEAMIEYADVRDVGKAEMALAGKDIGKGVLIQVGRRDEETNTDGGAAKRPKTMTLPFAPAAAKRPGQSGPRRGGRGGLGFRRAPGVDEADKSGDADGDTKMKDGATDGKAKANGDAEADGAGSEGKTGKSQADFRAMLAGK